VRELVIDIAKLDSATSTLRDRALLVDLANGEEMKAEIMHVEKVSPTSYVREVLEVAGVWQTQ
jgi:hypothetical protein